MDETVYGATSPPDTFFRATLEGGGDLRSWWESVVGPMINDARTVTQEIVDEAIAIYSERFPLPPWCSVVPVDSFKEQHRIQVNGLGLLPIASESEKFDPITDPPTFKYSVETQGSYINTSTSGGHDYREGVIRRVEGHYEKLSYFAHHLLHQNAPLSHDNLPVFSPDRGNFFTSLSCHSLCLAIDYLRMDSRIAASSPLCFVCKNQLISMPFLIFFRERGITVVYDRNLSHNDWRLVIGKPVEIGFLGGQQYPALLLQSVDASGITFKLRWEWGGVLLGHQQVAGGYVVDPAREDVVYIGGAHWYEVVAQQVPKYQLDSYAHTKAGDPAGMELHDGLVADQVKVGDFLRWEGETFRVMLVAEKEGGKRFLRLTRGALNSHVHCHSGNHNPIKLLGAPYSWEGQDQP